MATHRQLPPNTDIAPWQERGRWYHIFVENMDSHPTRLDADYYLHGDPDLHLVDHAMGSGYVTNFPYVEYSANLISYIGNAGGEYIRVPAFPEFEGYNPSYYFTGIPIRANIDDEQDASEPVMHSLREAMESTRGVSVDWIFKEFKVDELDMLSAEFWLLYNMPCLVIPFNSETNASWLAIPFGTIPTTDPYNICTHIIYYKDNNELSAYRNVAINIDKKQIYDRVTIPANYDDTGFQNEYVKYFQLPVNFNAISIVSTTGNIEIRRIADERPSITIPGGIVSADIWIFGYFE